MLDLTHRGGATSKSGSTTYRNMGEAWRGSIVCQECLQMCRVVAGASEVGILAGAMVCGYLPYLLAIIERGR